MYNFTAAFFLYLPSPGSSRRGKDLQDSEKLSEPTLKVDTINTVNPLQVEIQDELQVDIQNMLQVVFQDGLFYVPKLQFIFRG